LSKLAWLHYSALKDERSAISEPLPAKEAKQKASKTTHQILQDETLRKVDEFRRWLTLIEKPAYLPQYEGVPAIDVWRNITGCDPLLCPKCKTGRMIAKALESRKEPEPG
jgi:hypothetical protein